MDKGFDNTRKMYMLMYLGTGFLHCIYTLMAKSAGMYYLKYYNVYAVIYYIFLAFLVTKIKNVSFCFILCSLEMIALAFVGTMTTGYESGFTLFLLCIVPLSFYLTYQQADEFIYIFSKTTWALGYSVANIFFFFLFTYLGMTHEHLVTITPFWIKNFYILNACSASTLLFGFFVVFIKTVNGNEAYLEDENDKLKDAVNMDALTKLLNRRTFDYYFEKKISSVHDKGRDFCLVMCDIDFFKKVNDTYGHDAGDKVLKFVSKLLSQSIRQSDQAFRWGGEEFLLLFDANITDTEQIMERCRKQIEDSVIHVGEDDIKVTISIGIKGYKSMETSESMIKGADTALYTSKETGRNKITIADSIKEV